MVYFPSKEHSLTYTCFDKVKTITQGNNTLEYTYGYDRQRIFMEEHANGVERTKRYVGNCEFVAVTENNVTTEKTLTYLTGPMGVFAVVETSGNEDTLHYILKDHLGGWTTITDAEGVIEQELSFDAWGTRRNPETWHSSSQLPEPMFDRGFTGHEHLYAFGLINMNGRMYDPQMSSFLSVDAYVQSPDNSQSFNRYAYCLNNPLKYTDPSGWVMQGGMTPSNPFHENWGVNLAEHVVTSHEAREILRDMGISIGTWMMGNEMCGVSGGRLGSDYTVDKQGYVTNMGGNNMIYDILYTSDAYASGDYSNGLIVYDLSILSCLTEGRSDYQGSYTATTSKKEAFDVFYFMAENTDVEWGIDGYRVSGGNEYVIRTSHSDGSVTNLNTTRYYEMNCTFMMHSHCWPDGTRGASIAKKGNTLIDGDMLSISTQHTRFERQGMKDINVWFKYKDTYSVFPKHYVYHKHSNNLYFYDVWVNNYFIRKINKANDLYRNLGF